jgi:hypothetical protein
MKEIKRLGGIFSSPSRVFAELGQDPRWIVPFLLVLVILSLSASLTVSFSREAILAQQREVLLERGLTEAQIQEAAAVTAGPMPMVLAGISTAVITGLLFLVAAALYNLLIPLLGGTSSFRRIFSTLSYSALVLIPGSILRLILVSVTRSPQVTTSLALFVPFLEQKSFGYHFLAGIDFFSIWQLAIFALGVSIITGLKKSRAYSLIFGIWICFLLGSTALGLAF